MRLTGDDGLLCNSHHRSSMEGLTPLMDLEMKRLQDHAYLNNTAKRPIFCLESYRNCQTNVVNDFCDDSFEGFDE